MELKRITYSEYVGGSQEWVLDDLTLGPVNLLVGKNATGKSRCLNVITGLASLLSGDRKQLFNSGTYDAIFESADGQVQYILEIKNSKVLQESFAKNGENFMNRGQGGAGEILAEEVGKRIRFQTPEASLAAVVRQDEIQHGFLECLSIWSKNLLRYEFASSLGKDHFALIQKGSIKKLNLRETSKVISIFMKGEKKFGEQYIDSIKKDFAQIRFYIEDIGVKKPVGIQLPNDIKGDPVGLYVKEVDLPGITEQISMANGMFRTLSLIIQINYWQMEMKPSCIVIDDIGEGLDFERSVWLINLVMEKAATSRVQLIMATNDRFVMNRVPLETFTVLTRDKNRCKVYSYANSKEKFDEFKFTGMNNFDFFESDFLSEERQDE